MSFTPNSQFPTPNYLRPFSIGGIRIDTPLTLAPMAGHTNYPFRALCREFGECGLVCTELISSDAMHYKSEKTRNRYLDWYPEEAPLAVQLFGSDPALMAEAARIVVDLGANIVDINMGCWVPKVAKKGAGAALLRDVCTATSVVEAVVKAVSVPVTVKVRAGFNEGDRTAVPFAKAAEQSGVAAIAVHGRTASQGFSGQADWSVIAEVKSLVKIPVIGNGDVRNTADAHRMFAETGCDAVMIGRAALGNPWIFREIAHELRTGEKLLPVPPHERAATALRHARLTLEKTSLSYRTAILELRGQLNQYGFGVHGANEMRSRIVRAESLEDIEAILLPIAEGLAQAG